MFSVTEGKDPDRIVILSFKKTVTPYLQSVPQTEILPVSKFSSTGQETKETDFSS